MTKLHALRALLAKPREADMGRIGYRVIYAKPDGREKQTFVVRVLRSITRRAA